ncbi:hypothetical protein STXM2123_5553 [Streptomyces sp. F-3]|nr:hypothetical protein STXM2123_5553 [Streptomyces sp. F-3]
MRNLPESCRHAPINSVIRTSTASMRSATAKESTRHTARSTGAPGTWDQTTRHLTHPPPPMANRSRRRGSGPCAVRPARLRRGVPIPAAARGRRAAARTARGTSAPASPAAGAEAEAGSPAAARARRTSARAAARPSVPGRPAPAAFRGRPGPVRTRCPRPTARPTPTAARCPSPSSRARVRRLRRPRHGPRRRAPLLLLPGPHRPAVSRRATAGPCRRRPLPRSHSRWRRPER